jgi:methyl-accepting chemotaxis protein
MKEKLEFKMFSLGTVIMITAVILINIFVLRIEKNDIYSLSRDRLEATARLITKGLEHSMMEGKADSTKNFVRDLRTADGFDTIQVFNKEGKIAFEPKTPVVEGVALKKITETGKHLILEKGQTIVYYMPLENFAKCRSCHARDGNILGAVKVSTSLKREYEKVTDFTIFMTVGSLLGLGVLGLIFRYLLRSFVIVPVQKLESAAHKMAEGDMSFKTKIKTNDEMGRLDGSIKESLVSISMMLRRVMDISRRIADTVEIVNVDSSEVVKSTKLEAEAVAEISSSVEQLNSAISEVAENTESLAHSVEDTASSMEEMTITINSLTKITHGVSEGVDETSSSIQELSATIKQVADSAGELASVSEETLSAVDEIISSVKEVETSAKESARLSEKVKEDASTLGVMSIKKNMDGMENIRSSVTKTSSVIEKLVSRSEEIGNILTVIDEITDQTTLLALNAAILAAQAGEHGKGFSIVANEIKDLAERTAFSTKEIDQLIKTVRQDVLDAVTAMDEGMTSVEEGIQLSKEASEALKKILNSAKLSSEMALAIERTTGEQAKTAIYVSESVERVRAMVGQIAKATAEQSRGVNHIIDAAEKMRDASHQADKATEQQAIGSRQISQAIETISDRTQHITKAIREQKSGSTQIWMSLEKIKDLPEKNRGLAFSINKELNSLATDSELVMTEMERFKLREEDHSDVIRCGIVPYENPAELFRKFSSLISYLSEKTDRKFELRVANDFETAVKEINEGITQLCFMTTGTYIEASKSKIVEPLAKVQRKGKPYYHASIITKQSSSINSIEDLKGSSFAFVDVHSTSGHLIPRGMLIEGGVGLEDLSFYDFLGHHDSVVRAVLKGEFDAGGVIDAIAEKYMDQGLKIIKNSQDIPGFNFCAGSMEEDQKAAIKIALLELNEENPDTSSVLARIDKYFTGLSEVKDTDYDAIRTLMSKLGID